MPESVVVSDNVKETVEHLEAVPSDDHLDRLLMSADLEAPWYKSIFRNIRETINPPKLPPLELTSHPVDGETLGEIRNIEQPWFKSLFASVKDLINPPKLPPLEVTSKPIEVGTIWGAYGGGESKSGAVSLLIHVGVIALLLLVFKSPIIQKKIKDVTDIYFPIQPYQPKLPAATQRSGGGGGGGQHVPQPVNRGEAPKFARKQFIPPTQAIPKPLLPVVPTISAQAPVILADNYGDPLSKSLAISGGPGSNGLGSGSGNGLGSGHGDGFGPGSGGGTGGGVYQIGGVDVRPVIITKVEPEYSEEARKAKYSGTVLLSIVIDPNGLPRDIHVIRPLGLGLDEKAIEAVTKWRFRAAQKGGHPVSMQAQIEVSFRLL